MKNLLLFIWVITLSSCNSKEDIIKDLLIGLWTIENITYKNQDVYECLTINSIGFNKEFECNIPGLDYCFPPSNLLENIKGKWEILRLNNKWNLKIDSKNAFFNKVFVINFKISSNNKILVVELLSDDLYLKCSKMTIPSNAVDMIQQIK